VSQDRVVRVDRTLTGWSGRLPVRHWSARGQGSKTRPGRACLGALGWAPAVSRAVLALRGIGGGRCRRPIGRVSFGLRGSVRVPVWRRGGGVLGGGRCCPASFGGGRCGAIRPRLRRRRGVVARRRRCAFGAQFEAVGADAVAAAVVLADALVHGVGLSEDGVRLVGRPDREQAGVVGLAVDGVVLVALGGQWDRAAVAEAWHAPVLKEGDVVGAPAAALADGDAVFVPLVGRRRVSGALALRRR
jgi:hypothetical protein